MDPPQQASKSSWVLSCTASNWQVQPILSATSLYLQLEFEVHWGAARALWGSDSADPPMVPLEWQNYLSNIHFNHMLGSQPESIMVFLWYEWLLTVCWRLGSVGQQNWLDRQITFPMKWLSSVHLAGKDVCLGHSLGVVSLLLSLFSSSHAWGTDCSLRAQVRPRFGSQ